jgi:hypothetical protein
MATFAKSLDLNAEQRLFLHNISWQTYAFRRWVHYTFLADGGHA